MLVNVSRFTAVQDRVRDLVDARLEAIKQSVRSFSRLPEKEALKDPELAALKRAAEQEFAGCGFGWRDLQGALHDALAPVVVRSVVVAEDTVTCAA